MKKRFSNFFSFQLFTLKRASLLSSSKFGFGDALHCIEIWIIHVRVNSVKSFFFLLQNSTWFQIGPRLHCEYIHWFVTVFIQDTVLYACILHQYWYGRVYFVCSTNKTIISEVNLVKNWILPSYFFRNMS